MYNVSPLSLSHCPFDCCFYSTPLWYIVLKPHKMGGCCHSNDLKKVSTCICKNYLNKLLWTWSYLFVAQSLDCWYWYIVFFRYSGSCHTVRTDLFSSLFIFNLKTSNIHVQQALLNFHLEVITTSFSWKLKNGSAWSANDITYQLGRGGVYNICVRHLGRIFTRVQNWEYKLQCITFWHFDHYLRSGQD